MSQMSRWWPIVLFLLPGGCVLAWWVLWRRRRAEEQRTDLVPRWAAFIESAPHIPPAHVPDVRERKAVIVDRFPRFQRRIGRR